MDPERADDVLRQVGYFAEAVRWMHEELHTVRNQRQQGWILDQSEYLAQEWTVRAARAYHKIQRALAQWPEEDR